jgi:hypothetical protein
MRRSTSGLYRGQPAAYAAASRQRPGVKRSSFAPETRGRPAASSDQPAPARRVANAASAAVVAVEVISSLLMWAAIPIAWMWVGARVYDATGSLAVDMGVALLGFLATTALAMRALNRLDRVWIALRRRAGHDQVKGALTQVVVVSATLGIVLFLVWFYILSHAFILPFMPSQ